MSALSLLVLVPLQAAAELDVAGLADPPVHAAVAGVERTVLGEAVPLALVVDDGHPPDRAVVEWVFVAGTRFAPADPPQVVPVLAALLADGAAAALADLDAAVAVGAGPAAIALRVDAPVDALDEVGRRIAAIVATPRDDADAIAAAEAALRADEQEARRDPARLANLVLDELARPEPAAVSRWRAPWPPLEPRHVEAWRRLALARGTLWLGALAHPDAAADVRAALDAAVAALPEGGSIARRPPAPTFQSPAETRVFLLDRPGTAECALLVGGPVPPGDRGAVRLAFDAVARALAADVPGARIRVSRPDGGGRADWRVEVVAPAGEAAAALGNVLERLRAARAGAWTAGAGERAALAEAERARLAADPGHRLHLAYAGRAPGDAAADVEELGDVTHPDLAAAFAAAVDPDRLAVVAVGPAATVAGPLAELAPLTRVPETGVRGDSYAAVVAVERMFDALGGRARWAGLTGFSLVGEVEAPGVAAPLRMELHHRFEPFALRLEQVAGGDTVAMVVREDGSWSLGPTGVSPLPPDRHRTLVSSAQRSLYGNLRRLARESALRARVADGALEVYDRDRFHALFRVELDADGRIAALGFGDPDRPGATLSRYSGWQETDGWPWPRRREDAIRGLVTRATFTPNPELDEELFSSGRR